MRIKSLLKIAVPAIALGGIGLPALGQVELTTNGDFEDGNTSGWTSFPTANSTFTVTPDASEGLFGGLINNPDQAAGAVVKQANIGIGTVTPGQTLQISFDAKGVFEAGGVAVAEFFSELSGGGTSSSQILGGGPLFVATQATYQSFSFDVVTGPDVSGGVSLQFVAATGGAAGSIAQLNIDNVSVRTIPEPTTAGLIGLGGLALLARRRRAA